MVQGCLQNLEHFGLPHESVEVADIEIEGMFERWMLWPQIPLWRRPARTGSRWESCTTGLLASLASVLDQGSRAGMVLPRPCPQRLQGLGPRPLSPAEGAPVPGPSLLHLQTTLMVSTCTLSDPVPSATRVMSRETSLTLPEVAPGR